MEDRKIRIHDLDIYIEQHGDEDFTVTYGLDVRPHLSYDQAAISLGGAIMHALACEGALVNEGDE